MAIRVIYKPTGQIGTIPDDKFDPTLFQTADEPFTPRVTQQQTVIPQTQTVQQQKTPGPLEKIGSFFAPRTTQTVKQLPQQLQTIMDLAKYESQNPPSDISEFLGRQQGRIAIQAKQALPMAGEIAPWFMGIPKGQQALTALGRIGQSAQMGGAVGGTRAATGSEQLPEIINDLMLRGQFPKPERIGALASETIPSALLGGAIGGAFQTGVEGLKGAGRFLKETGRTGMAEKIQPQVGKDVGFARKEEKAAEEVLKRTKAVTPRGIDKQIEDNIQNLSDEVQTRLSQNNQVVPEAQVVSNIRSNVEQGVSGFDVSKREWAKPLEKAISLITKRKEVSQGQMGVHETNISLLDLFKGKQDVGRWLDQNYTWRKLSLGQPLDPEDRVGIAVYNATKELIDEVTGNQISDLTNAEHMLYQAGKGIYQLAHRGSVQSPSIFAVYRFPIIGLIPNALDAVSILGNRAMWTVGDVLQSNDVQLQNAIIPLLNTYFSGTESTKKSVQQSPKMQLENRPSGSVQSRSKMAQEAINTSQDKQGTYTRIIKAEPDLIPYISP